MPAGVFSSLMSRSWAVLCTSASWSLSSRVWTSARLSMISCSLSASETMSFADFLRERGASRAAVELLEIGYVGINGDGLQSSTIRNNLFGLIKGGEVIGDRGRPKTYQLVSSVSRKTSQG